MSRDFLVKINYIVIFGILSISSLTVSRLDSPEQIIEGEWIETAWSIEKDNTNNAVSITSPVYQELKKEIFDDFHELHLGCWNFSENGKLISTNKHQNEQLKWYIKGRGHILELHRNGKRLESFQIQAISKDKMVLHLNFDLQVKGIIEIILERKNKQETNEIYAKEV
ncbi:hypothetical protein [Sphingobacterium sp. JB170]|uniref:hypothetical protein n=1 Tax=Sphingobacterium sp. JB170 TaxID=1434842 RepID=UPI00097F283D|nr:hypothetical protein [Sphingobacterium sp. JB170]SJN46766.1 hypothetical protein FM107_14935 [Sphingobacterium sp. JB170]